MADAKTRTFVKKDRDGKELTRQVSTPQGEVAALFDGYREQPAAKPAAAHTTTGGGKPAAAN